MLALARRLLYVVAVHAAVYSAYPHTGDFIKIFALLSMIGWSLLIILLHFSVKVKAATILSMLYDLLLIAVMGLAVCASMPQRDNVSVLEKLRQGRYPTRRQVEGGVNRLSGEIKDPAVKIRKTTKELKTQVEQARAERDAARGEKAK